MIQVKEFGFNNMFSYGEDVVLKVNERVTQLIGANGHGKSSIPTALEELLYNKNSKGLKKSSILNRYAKTPKYSGYVNMLVDGVEYCITKHVASTTKLTLQKDGVDISGHTTTQTYKLIENILGIDFNTFTKLVYQSTDSSLDFLNATDANRKKFLVSLLGLEEYVEAETTIKEALKETKSAVDKAQAATNTVAEWIRNTNDVPKEIARVDVPAISSSLAEDLETKVIASSNVEYHNNIVRTNLKAISQHKKLVEERIPEVEFSKPEMLEVGEVFQAKKLVVSDLNSDVKSLNKELEKTKAIKEHCHVCNSKLDVGNKEAMLEVVNAKLSSLHAKLSEATRELQLVQTQYNKLEIAERGHKSHEQYIKSLKISESALDSTKPTEYLDTSELSAEISKLRASIEEEKAAIDLAIKHNSVADTQNSEVRYRTKQLAKFKEDMVTLTSNLEEVTVVQAKTEVLAKALGSKGLIAYKIESMLKTFEELINHYLQILADGNFALSFSVEDTKLALSVHCGEHVVDIKSLSSGEFNKVNTATLLAVRKLMTSISKVDLNLLFLDEVMSVLDLQGRDTLVELLLKEHTLNSIVVSHEYTHPLASVIKVTKVNNISGITYE